MSKYDDILTADQQDRQRQVASTASVASKYNPDQYAQAIDTGSRLGVPAPIIANNPQAFDRPNKYSQLLDQDDAPTTQEWLTNFDNAAVAQDDVESLSGLERALRLIRKGYEFNDRATQTLKDAGRQAAYEFAKLPGVTLEGAGRIYEALGRYAERGLRALGGETAANIAGANIQVPWYLNPAEILKQPGQTIKEAVEPLAVPEERQNLATDIGGGLGQLTGQALTAILTGGTTTTVTLLSQGADIMGERAEDAGATPEQTDAAVLMGASITALTERYGLDALLNRLPPQIKNAFLRRLIDAAVGGGIEAAQEAVEGVLHNLTAKAIFDPDAPIFEGIEREALAAGGSGAIARAIIGAIIPGRQASFADQDKRVAEQIAQAAQQSKLSTRSPQKLEELVSAIKEQTGSEFAYVDAAAFRTLYQSDQEASQAAAELTGSTQTYFEAAVSNTKLAIPLEKYVSRIAANKDAQALIDHVTFTPDGLTAEEAKAERELFEGRAKEIADREVTEARPDSSQAVYDDVLGQLLQTGMERSTAERNAALTQVVFRTLGQRTGIDAQELYRRYGLNVRRDIPGIMGAASRVDTAIDPIIDQLRAGDIPTEAQAAADLEAGDVRSMDRRATLVQLGDFLAERGVDVKTTDNAAIKKLLSEESGTQFDQVLRDSVNNASQVAFDQGNVDADGQPSRTPGNQADQNSLRTVGGQKPAEGWATATRIRGKSGRPLRIYRGAQKALDAQDFTDEALGKATGHPSSGLGVFFTTDQEDASRYGEVAGAFIDIRKPKVLKIEDVPAFDSIEDAIVWREKQKKAGFDGLVISSSHLGGPNWVVAFDANQVIPEQMVLFQSSDKDLIIQHSITEEKLLHALRMGGIAVPSLAITKKDQAITGFGDITLIGPSSMAEPSADTKVFGADIYSPRYPSVEFKIHGAALKLVNAELKPYREEGDREIYSGEISKADDLIYVDAFKRYAEDKLGKSTDYHAMKSLAEELLVESGADERIFRGFTNSGNRRYVPHTIENVVKILKKELRGGEGFNYGIGSLRAKYTPQFKSVAQIRKAKGKLVTEDEFKTIKEEIDKEFFEVANLLAPYYKHESNKFGFSDVVIATLEDAPRFGLRGALRENQFNEVEEADLKTVVAFLEKLRNLPTGYFETKILRPVQISEFTAAIVPSGTSQKMYDLLESNGIEVRTYTRGEDADRQQVVSSVSTDLQDKILFQRFNETKRGAIQFGTDRQFTISLLEKADLSTFLHESGHFYLEILGDLAEDANAPQQIKDDFAKVLKWMKVKSRAEIGVEQHEMWARGFEAYLMEGKAPSVELQSVFARFRAWLVSVYKTLTRLNVELTDEVRGVMDRLVATDEEIQAAEESQNYAPIFTSAEQAGMSPEEWAAYQNIAVRAHEEAVEEMTDRAMKQLTREQKAWWKEERAKMVESVTAEVNAQPVYRAIAFLQKGKNADGSDLPEGVQAVKLHKDALVDRYGKDFLKRLPRGLTAKEGINADLAATMFDFDSGDALVEALANARPKAQLIEMEADARMREKYGDMLTDGSITDVAMKSVHTDGRAKVMAAELKALNRKRREVQPFVKAAEKQATREQKQSREANAATLPDVDELKVIKVAVQRIIQTKKVREIQPNLYRLAEAKAARKAFDLAGKGKFEEAYIEKRRQILNHELYRAAVKAREEVDSIVEYMRTFDKRASRERLGKAGGQYLEQIDAIRERFDFSNVSNIADLKRTALAEWVAEQRAKGLEVAIPDSVLNEARRTPYKELLLAELQGLHDAVKNIDHLSRLKNKLLAAAAKRDFDDTVTDVVASIDEHHKRTPEIVDFAPRFGQKLKKGVKRYFAEHTKMEFLFSWLDGEKDLGSTWQALFKPIADAENIEQAKMRDARAELTKILSAYSKSELSGMFTRKVYVPEVSASFTRASLLSVALNSGNEYNREVLLRGYGWNEAQLTAILSKLDGRDWNTVEAIWTHIDSYWPDVAALQKDLTGLPPEKVEAMPFLTPGGRQVRGGYYPLKYDADTSERQNQQDEAQSVTEMFGGNFARIATRQGHTKARTDSGGKKVKLDLGVYTEHVTNVIHDLAFRRAVLDVDRLIQDSRIEQAIIETAGRVMYRQLRPWLRNIAADYRQPMNTVEKILNHARAGASIVSMGFKITTAIVQPLGYLQSVEMLGAKYAGIGLKEFYGRGTPQSMARAKEFVFERSEQMRNRMTTFDRDVRDQLKGLQDRGSKIRRSFFFLTGAMDMTVSLPTWLGAYRKAMDGAVDGIDAGNELAAIDYADSTVRKSQSAGGAKDLAGIQSGHPLFKLFTTFYSYFNVMYNLMARRIGQTKSAADIPQLVSSAMLLWFLPAILSELIAQRGPDDDEEWGEWFAENWHVWGLYPLQGLIGFREIVQAMGPFGYDGPPALDAISQTGRALTIPVKALDEEQDVTRADVKSAVLATSYWGHLPGRQAWITGEYMYDYMTGEVDEFSFRDALFARPRE